MARYNIRFLSKSLLRKVEVNLIIPSLDLHSAINEKNERYYQENKNKYPLVILLSGFADDNESFMTKANIFELCDKYKIAVAVMGGENKWYLNSSPIDNWSNLITTELPDFLYGNFSCLDNATPLVLGGVSMGGYGALYNGIKYRSKFSAILSLSPALKPDSYFNEEDYGTLRNLILEAKSELPYVYLAVGNKDFIIEPSIEFDKWLSDNKIGFNYKIVEGFGHSWDLWRTELLCFFEELKTKKIIK